MSRKLTGLLNHLLQNKIISDAVVEKITTNTDGTPVGIAQYLSENNLLTASQTAFYISQIFGLPYIDINALDVTILDKKLIPIELIQKHNIIPILKRNKNLVIAVADPTNDKMQEEIRFNTGFNLQFIITEFNRIEPFIRQHIEASEFFESNEQEIEEEVDMVSDDESEAPVVRFINKMLLSAIKSGASDLHFEPYEKMYRVRFRTDGILEEVAMPPIDLTPKLISRLKIMSDLDISEKRKPQDGRIKFKVTNHKAVDFRVNTCPTLWGEKIVLRILDSSSAKLGIDALGYDDAQKKMYLEALHQPQGMILVTGPTGSGKTVSLYTGLNILNTPERNISTVEDPVEINLEGINQVNINLKQGLDFAGALRAFLRQDPDVIMVGEIRDLETANIAIKAAQTGHMVLSTLHTNSAAETLTRLQHMGVAAFNVATSVSLIIAQRLARRLCNHCKQEIKLPYETLLEEGFTQHDTNNLIIYSPKGCDLCHNGYKGRVGIYEVVKMVPEMQAVVMKGGNSLDISEVAKKLGFHTLRQAGLKKVKEGLTSIEEVNRVTCS